MSTERIYQFTFTPCAETVEMLTRSGEALHGEFWRGRLSEALGYASTRSSLRRWLDGETPLPKSVPSKLSAVLFEASEKITPILHRIEAQLESQKGRPISGKFEESMNAENLKNLEEVGLLIFGENWEKALATSIGYSRWGVRDWKRKKRNTPDVLPWLLFRFLRHRLDMIDSAKESVENYLSKN